MLSTQIPKINPGEISGREERKQMADGRQRLSSTQKNDAKIKESVNRALWKDGVLRALNSYETDAHAIDIQVKNGIVYLSGHILNTAEKNRIENAIRDIPGILGFWNNLVLDDHLTIEVASALGELEHTYSCKFFTGVSHGVVSLNGVVSDENVKLLAEKCAAHNPNVRGVINNVRVSGSAAGPQNLPFLQPGIGEPIYFLDGISGVVKQVIINPNNRRVIAMTVYGKFTDQREDLGSLIILRISVVRYLTRVSGFLNISSNEKNEYVNFDADYFIIPDKDWVPPYPYRSEDVLFPAEYRNEEIQIASNLHQFPFAAIDEDVSFRKQFIANDSFGGYDEE